MLFILIPIALVALVVAFRGLWLTYVLRRNLRTIEGYNWGRPLLISLVTLISGLLVVGGCGYVVYRNMGSGPAPTTAPASHTTP